MINRNNFLRWEGELQSFPFQNIAGNVAVTMPTGFTYVDVDVISTCTSSFGVDVNSIVVISKDNATAPSPQWVAEDQRLRIYRPTDGALSMSLKYVFKDNLGNSSSPGLVSVDLSILSVSWRGYAPSLSCTTNAFNQNTGKRAYNLLERFFTVSGNPFLPQELKANVPSDTDYIAPFNDLAACPVASIFPLTIRNEFPVGTADIKQLRWKKTGSPDIINVLNLSPGGVFTLNFQSGSWDQLIVELTNHSTPAGTKGCYYSYGPTPAYIYDSNLTWANFTILNPIHTIPTSIIRTTF